MHLSRSFLIAGGILALTATAAFAGEHLPPPQEAHAGLSTAAGKAGLTVPVNDSDHVSDHVPALPDAAETRNAENAADDAVDGDGVVVPENFGQLVSEFARENASTAGPGAVADYVHETLGIEPGGDAGNGDGTGAPEQIPPADPDLSGLPEQAPDLSGVPTEAGPPDDAGRAGGAGRPDEPGQP